MEQDIINHAVNKTHQLAQHLSTTRYHLPLNDLTQHLKSQLYKQAAKTIANEYKISVQRIIAIIISQNKKQEKPQEPTLFTTRKQDAPNIPEITKHPKETQTGPPERQPETPTPYPYPGDIIPTITEYQPDEIILWKYHNPPQKARIIKQQGDQVTILHQPNRYGLTYTVHISSIEKIK